MTRTHLLHALSVLAAALGLVRPAAVHASAVAAWPEWRGTSGAGIAPGATPPTTWSETRNVRWKSKIPGAGFSTPIIWGDRIFLLTAIETDEEIPTPAAAAGEPPAHRPGAPATRTAAGETASPSRKIPAAASRSRPKPTKVHAFTVLALARHTGAIVWQRTARREVPHEGHHPSHGFASASPVTDGERLYAAFGSRGYYCYDLQGNLLWEKDLGYLRTHGTFGEGSSPVLAGGKLIIKWDHEDQSFIVALDARTGAEIWRQLRDERTSWSTPLVVETGGRQQVIVPATKYTRSYDAATGELLWQAAGLTADVVPVPVAGHGLVFVMSGFRGNAIQAIKLTARGDVTDTDAIVWSTRRSAPYVPSPVLSGGRLFMGKGNNAFLSCLDARTGKVLYQDQPLPGIRGLYASPLAANGHLYVVGREGTTLVLKDAPTFEIVATNILEDRFDASPVAVENEFYLRGHQHLYCLVETRSLRP